MDKIDKIKAESERLYKDIDDCIAELINARTNKDADAEGKALFRMEGLMVGTLQHLACIIEPSENIGHSEDLQKAAEESAHKWRKNLDGSESRELFFEPHIRGFKEGAEWQKEQMMKEAVEGVVQDRGEFINFGDGKYIDLDPTMQLRPVFEVKDGDKVKIIIIKSE